MLSAKRIGKYSNEPGHGTCVATLYSSKSSVPKSFEFANCKLHGKCCDLSNANHQSMHTTVIFNKLYDFHVVNGMDVCIKSTYQTICPICTFLWRHFTNGQTTGASSAESMWPMEHNKAHNNGRHGDDEVKRVEGSRDTSARIDGEWQLHNIH